MTCLETTFLIDLLRGSPSVKIVKDQLSKEENLTIALPSIMELWIGALLSKHTETEKEKIHELLESFDLLPFDVESAKTAAEIQYALLQKGASIQLTDTMIAAIAQVHGHVLVTRDEHFARIPGLRVLKY